MTLLGRHFRLRLALLGAVVLALALAAVWGRPAGSSASVQAAIESKRAVVAELQARIAADSRAIERTSGGVANAEQRFAGLQAATSAKEDQLAALERSLLAARDHLVDLENKALTSSQALAANLVAAYEGNTPTALTVVLSAHGFADLLDQLSFVRAIGEHDANTLRQTRAARRAVITEAVNLGALEARDERVAAGLIAQRNQAAELHAALLHAQIAEIQAHAADASQLSSVQGQLQSLEAQQAAANAAAAAAAAAAQQQEQAQAQAQANAAPSAGTVGSAAPSAGPTGSSSTGSNGIELDPGGAVQPPAGAPAAVDEVIAAGNAIATLPYVYGGGHASFQADAYDCSGSVSYALAAAGLVTAPLDSTEFMSWGLPGPGKWITVYARDGHAFMYVAGWRFDTVALAEDGTRWSSTPADTAGFVARHPAGL